MLSLPDPSRHYNRIHNTDALEFFRSLPDQSVQTIVTSPPYYGLRDYGVDGQLGLEDTPQAYIARLVGIFDAARRVLRDDCTLWINLGDSYYNYRPGKGQALVQQSIANTNQDLPQVSAKRGKAQNYPEKSLMMIPARFAIAMQDAGWILRNDIIWHKPNPMPESVKDRCTNAHEHIFLFSKKPKYYCNMDAIREPHLWADRDKRADGKKHLSNGKSKSGNYAMDDVAYHPLGRNKRDVWTVSTKPYSGAHFAVFPPDLIEPCILAGTPAGGVVCDPFMGAGTTALVAIKHGRQWVGCEINAEYIKLAYDRITKPIQVNLFTST